MYRAFFDRVLRIPAQLVRLADVRAFIEDAGRELGLGPSDRYALRLAVTEAVTNAVRHGSPSDQDEVEVRAAVEGDALAIYIADSGRFVPRVALPEELAERGRGLDFMDQLMDEVEIRPSPRGTVVRLAKRLASPPVGDPA